ncbi:HNH endonuclease [Mycobacteroides abscessus subsp. massiliense]|uniref:HNH endonuclease n=1 Tax=Mycobacteroides abscessus TaxID=36809 RepID=UPI0009A8DDAF|nr:HNH endonuclease signature motif containing protein [Mycobacteroides abscessus]SKM82433.1 HNH endonuclease [Mycobacteroides abscessus subsp. massiliense]SKM99191.1 HNH endonuclease [Mycobacteroides abscessus subsp. massiliense]SKN77767.1 HNH endonuclease [Mycobacteroides abscessus subsp. massiliense]SKN95509.1 HNH endonuclease [Mycobacteroides abscessus subsp. massiliense]SKO23015.1 HNH endonuclease [Mycobacteroides abscessus subsp. massiliense]
MTVDDVWAEPYISVWNEENTREHVKGRNPTGLCEYCGKKKAVDMHHRENRSQGGGWCPANIIWICRSCHHFATTRPAWAESVGLTIKHGQTPTGTPVKLPDGRELVLHNNYLPKGRNA